MRVTFPHLLLDQAGRFRLSGQSRESQEGLSGAVTTVASLSAHWTAQITFALKGEASHLAFQAFMAGMEGNLGRTLVPAVGRYRPVDRDGHGIARGGIAHLSGAETFEHFGFENAPVPMMVLGAAAALRATQIKVVNSNTTGLRPGQRFSIGEGLYEAQLVWIDGSDCWVQFQPPLRKAAASGAALVLDHPACLMQRSDEGDGGYDERMTRLQSVTLNFREAI
ncbi:hypothetical protein GCM10010873_26570 [Cypionkella aquatica]|uniref:Uncharacterized protein n=1 Tax=Cypionkella aquatica TaxID=1756042 RepID=A0AA37TXF8_9RHOB|nr:hypothetical protein [Cypionkella aquatica]GLS87683.1 hypothetical protein GCM10010873_26570 [Cypionkella aquatica]